MSVLGLKNTDAERKRSCSILKATGFKVPVPNGANKNNIFCLCTLEIVQDYIYVSLMPRTLSSCQTSRIYIKICAVPI